jgi:hypothetical protein
MFDWDDWEHLQALRREIDYLVSLLQPEDTGHIRTAISVLEWHVNELEQQLYYPDDVEIGH